MLESGIWNALAYGAFGFLIYAFQTGRAIHVTVVLTGIVLGAYAYFLGNMLFVFLQGLIVASSALQLMHVSRQYTTGLMLFLTAIVVVTLLLEEVIVGVTDVFGAVGLTGIAFGLIVLPARSGSLILTGSSALLALYSFTSGAWVFFFLNIFFMLINGNNWRKMHTKYSAKIANI